MEPWELSLFGEQFRVDMFMTGTKDQWYVYHTCEPDVLEEERSWIKGTAGTMMFGSPVSP